MSVLQFSKAQTTGEGFAAKCCQEKTCNSSGRWRMWLMGRYQGLVCSTHRKAYIKIWDGCLEREEEHVAA